MSKAKEPTANLRLAEALRRLHPEWAKADDKGIRKLTAERAESSEGKTLFPDLLLRPSSLVAPIGIETEFIPARNVEQEAQNRLGLSLQGAAYPIEQCFAVQLDESLTAYERDDEWAAALASAEYQFCLYQKMQNKASVRWPEQGWITGSLSVFAQSLECAILSPSLLTQGMDWLEEGVQRAATVLRNADMPHVINALATVLKQEASAQTTRMSVAIIANALNFHMSIAETHKGRTLAQLRSNHGLSQSQVLDEWERILREINYLPIFRIAVDLLRPIPTRYANSVLKILEKTADQLAGIGATTLHDMSGRMLQQLIADRKFLAANYTLPLSAALLAELAVSRLTLDETRDSYTDLRIGDLACGTGTLISAAYQSVLMRYRRTGGNDRDLHKSMMENSLYALDIMPVATHLTASQLASAHPGDTFKRTQIHTMPFGWNDDMRRTCIGSLDLLEGSQPSLFPTHEQVVGEDSLQAERASFVVLEKSTLDLAIMNPPYVRATNHEIADKLVPPFAAFGIPEEDQREMAKRLKKLRDGLEDSVGHGNAGLGSYFMDLANFALKAEGGVLALVLPLTLVQGESWQLARELLVRRYTDITILSMLHSVDRNWSADTNMAEVMLLATSEQSRTRSS